MPNATYRYDVHKAFQIFFDPTYGLMHYLSKNLVSSFIPSGLHVNVVYDLPVCLAAMQAGRGESQPENAKGNGHFSRNPSSPYDPIPTLFQTPLFYRSRNLSNILLTVLVEEDGAGDDEGDDGESDHGAQE